MSGEGGPLPARPQAFAMPQGVRAEGVEGPVVAIRIPIGGEARAACFALEIPEAEALRDAIDAALGAFYAAEDITGAPV